MASTSEESVVPHFVDEYTYRHIPLATPELRSLIEQKNTIYEKEMSSPHTQGVFPTDVHPEINGDEFNFQCNWIMNTNSFHSPGTHWVAVLYNKHLQLKSINSEASCTSVKYYIIDSWGMN